MNKFFVINFFTYYLDPLLELRFNEFFETKTLRFFHNSTIITYIVTIMPTFKFLDKNIIHFSNASPRLLFWTTILFFVDASKDWTMADDAIMFSSLLVMLIENEKLKESPIDVNVSQWPREK